MSLLQVPGLLNNPKFLFTKKPNWLGEQTYGGGMEERSLFSMLADGNTVAWYRPGIGVTGTLNASAWANQLGAAGSLAQATGANQPIVLPFTGSKYGWFPGVNSNDLSSPDKAAPLGDMAIAIRVAADDFTPSAAQYLFSKHNATGGQSGIQFYLNTTGLPALQWSNDGTTIVGSASTVAPTTTDGTATWLLTTLDVDDGGVWKIRYYQSNETVDDPASVASWTLLDTITGGGTTSQFNNTAAFVVGGFAGGATLRLAGKVFRAVLYSDLALTTKVVDFNAADWSETSTNGATQVSSTTGETWTLNNTGALKAQIVGSPSLLFDGVSDFMGADFTLVQPEMIYLVARPVSWTDQDYIFDGATTNKGLLMQETTTPRVAIYAGTMAAANTNWAVGAYGVISVLFNGASSSLQINSTAATTGNPGTSNMGGMTLAANGDRSSGNAGNIQVKEIIIRNVADSAATQARIQALLRSIHGTP